MVLICKTYSPFYLGKLYAKFGLNWPISSEEEFFFIYIFHQYIFAISWLSPFEKGHGPSFEHSRLFHKFPEDFCIFGTIVLKSCQHKLFESYKSAASLKCNLLSKTHRTQSKMCNGSFSWSQQQQYLLSDMYWKWSFFAWLLLLFYCKVVRTKYEENDSINISDMWNF